MDRLHAQRGFTLVEALVALIVGTLALLGLYRLVDASNRITKQQTDVADVQQSARIGVAELSRIIRQSRIGGLYYGNAVLPIANNGSFLTNATAVSVDSGTKMTDLQGKNHTIRSGTDVIEVRGVIFGDKYILNDGSVTCNPRCDNPSAQITVTIPATATLGFQNFPNGGTPSLAGKTKPFYFVVLNGENQQVTVNGKTCLVPVYTAGRVDAVPPPGKWYTQTPTTFTFNMSQDTKAQKLNATTTLPVSLAKSISGGPVDVIRFFVEDTGDTHPSLAEAVWDPQSEAWDVQTLIEEVEDLQIAYGVDGITTNPRSYDSGVDPVAVDLSAVNKDEWVGNIATEVEQTLTISEPDANHSGVDAFIESDPAVPSGQLAVPALRSVWVSLVVKSTDPDLVFDGPGARGIKILDSTAVSFSASTGRPYRRRPLSLAVSLRNNGLSNK